MSAVIELCPFCGPTCGSRPRVQSRAAKCASGRQHFVRCAMCHTEGPRSNLNEAEAIAAWNRRPAPQVALTDALPRWIDEQKGSDPNIDDLIDYIEQIRAAQCIEARNQQGDAGWISVDKQMPPSGQRVIFGWVNALGNWRTSIGNWNARFTQEAQNIDEEACEYNEADDNHYLIEGWNEWGWELEFSAYVSDLVTHWMPVPPPAIEQRKADKKGNV